MPLFNGTTKYVFEVIEDTETLHIDACLQSVGGVWRRYFYSEKLPQLFHSIDFSITHCEKINILVVLRTWDSYWTIKRVVIKSDNMAVVKISKNGYTRDIHLASFARNIWLVHMPSMTLNLVSVVYMVVTMKLLTYCPGGASLSLILKN